MMSVRSAFFDQLKSSIGWSCLLVTRDRTDKSRLGGSIGTEGGGKKAGGKPKQQQKNWLWPYRVFEAAHLISFDWIEPAKKNETYFPIKG